MTRIKPLNKANDDTVKKLAKILATKTSSSYCSTQSFSSAPSSSNSLHHSVLRKREDPEWSSQSESCDRSRMRQKVQEINVENDAVIVIESSDEDEEQTKVSYKAKNGTIKKRYRPGKSINAFLISARTNNFLLRNSRSQGNQILSSTADYNYS